MVLWRDDSVGNLERLRPHRSFESALARSTTAIAKRHRVPPFASEWITNLVVEVIVIGSIRRRLSAASCAASTVAELERSPKSALLLELL